MSVPELSPTEERIVLLLAAGVSKPEIAADIGLDELTVNWHLKRASRKLEAATALHKRVVGAVPPPAERNLPDEDPSTLPRPSRAAGGTRPADR